MIDVLFRVPDDDGAGLVVRGWVKDIGALRFHAFAIQEEEASAVHTVFRPGMQPVRVEHQHAAMLLLAEWKS